MHEELAHIHDDLERLRRVTGFLWLSKNVPETPMLTAVILGFDRNTIAFTVNEDDSMAVVAPSELQSDTPKSKAIDLRAVTPWQEAMGLPLLWSWTLTNQQGYLDGFQLEFAQDVSSPSVLVQMLAVAGEVQIRPVCPDFVSTLEIRTKGK